MSQLRLTLARVVVPPFDVFRLTSPFKLEPSTLISSALKARDTSTPTPISDYRKMPKRSADQMSGNELEAQRPRAGQKRAPPKTTRAPPLYKVNATRFNPP